MSRSLPLTRIEMGKIDQLKELGYSQRKIAETINRSKTVVQQYLANPSKYGQNSNKPRKKAVGKRTLKKIIKLASNKVISAAKIKAQLDLPVCRITVSRYLGSSGTLTYRKMKGRPELTPEHRKNRREYAFNHIDWKDQWNKVMFSDEKKFNLDGPDGYHYYWHNINDKEITYSRRVQGGGSVMVWAGFHAEGKTPITFISTRMDSRGYTRMLQQSMIPFLPEDCIFQQDNAPCHRANLTMEWMEMKGINIMEWPSRSPDLNPIENLWGILSSKVYSGGKQYNNVQDLKNAIIRSWDEINDDTIKSLVRSMHKRMILTAKANGDGINY